MNQLTIESMSAIAGRKANERFQRQAAEWRFLSAKAEDDHRRNRNRLLVALVASCAVIGAVIVTDSPTAQAAPVLAKSEMTKAQLASLNVFKPVEENRHAMRNK